MLFWRSQRLNWEGVLRMSRTGTPRLGESMLMGPVKNTLHVSGQDAMKHLSWMGRQIFPDEMKQHSIIVIVALFRVGRSSVCPNCFATKLRDACLYQIEWSFWVFPIPTSNSFLKTHICFVDDKPLWGSKSMLSRVSGRKMDECVVFCFFHPLNLKLTYY